MKKTILLLLAAAAWAGDDADAKHAEKAKSIVRKLDADGDGKISRDEFIGSASIFDRWDADKDGFVTEAELTAALAAPKPEPKAAPKGGPKGPRKGPDDRERLQRQVDGVLKRLDKDGDGKLSGDEIPKRGDWKRMDANGDGAIDAAELHAAFMARMRSRGPGPDVAQRLFAMDADKDGKISREEWKGRPEGFARLDADKDGFLTKKEIDEIAKRMRRRGGWKAGPSEALFRRMDADGDRRITKEEWKLNPELFARFDANGDGVITADEVLPDDPRQPAEASGGADAFWKRHDKNGDGKIDAKEFANEKRFAAMDRDGDGVLSRAEVEQAFDKRDREEKMTFLERFDRNRDGKVTREEFTGPAKVFDRMDRNGDGVIDKADRKK